MIRELSEFRPKQRRIPDRDIIDVGGPSELEAEPPALRHSDRTKPPARPTLTLVAELPRERRPLTRLLTALLILELSFFGAIYLGKRYAEAQIIVVPVPASDRSVITHLIAT